MINKGGWKKTKAQRGRKGAHYFFFLLLIQVHTPLQVPHDETRSRLLTVLTRRECLYHVVIKAFRRVETVLQKAFDMTRILDEENSHRVKFYLSPMTTPTEEIAATNIATTITNGLRPTPFVGHHQDGTAWV